MGFSIGTAGAAAGALEQVCYNREEFYRIMSELIRFQDALNGMYVATFIGICIGFLVGVGYMRNKHGLE